MKVTKLFLLLFIFITTSCGKREYFVAEINNPVYKPNILFKGSEDLSSPKFGHLVKKYQLDTIFHGQTDELKRILLLRHWIKSIVKISDFETSYPGDGDVEKILDAAINGQGYHCGHFMLIQNALMNAYGYLTRTLGAGPGVKGGPDGHHGINEIWLNDHNKWFLSDAKYDWHFEKNGIPLSALEIRDEFLNNQAADILKVKGPDRISIDVEPSTGSDADKARSAQTYTWIEWHGNNDMFSAWPNHQELLVMYEDEYFKNNTWIWDSKPHWAYAKPEFMLKDPNRDAIYWTPNTISSKVSIEGNKTSIELIAEPSNLKEYQMKNSASGEWQKVSSKFEIDLKEKKYELNFRAVNLANISGPEHRVLIDSK